jgi:hypothetical protein
VRRTRLGTWACGSRTKIFTVDIGTGNIVDDIYVVNINWHAGQRNSH